MRIVPQEFIIAPQVAAQHATFLNRQAEQLDRLLDHPDHGPQPIGQSGLLEQIGSLLWEASGLQAREILDALEKAREDEEPLRIIITGEAFQHLPWELLYYGHPELGFLGRHPWCVLARRTRGDGRKAPRSAARPMRLLLFIASPEDLPPERSRLDFERTEELLFTALDGPYSRGELDIDVAEDGAFSTLMARLQENRYHAVILSMHGAPARSLQGAEEWGLLFEDESTGQSCPVAGSALASELDKLPPGQRPGLVVLSACRSARAQETASSIPSVVRTLHDRGFERVVGMRLSVLDGAASVFNAELFRRLAKGEFLGRAMSLARDRVARGDWPASGGMPPKGEAVGDLFGQWSVPVLLDRTADGPLVDLAAPAEITPRPPLPTVLIGDGLLKLPSRESFIGRRAEIRQHLRPFLESQRPILMLTGPGGVGKTTLAGLFARRLVERQPGTRLLGFRAPFDLGSLYEPIRRAAFDGTEEPGLQASIQAEPDLKERLRRLLLSLAGRPRPCAFLLDNLEALQDLATLQVSPQQQDSLWLVRTVCRLPAPTRVLLTGRYTFPELPADLVTPCPVPDAPYGDILRRLRRLPWPPAMGADQKRWVYRVLGGNHRAIEWAAQLLGGETIQGKDLLAALEQVQVPPNTPDAAVQVVLEAMRQNLLLDSLRRQLTPAQDRLLRAASLYRVPVHADGLLAVEADPEHCELNHERLLYYSLLEEAVESNLGLAYYWVPPVVRELLGEAGFSPAELKDLHTAMGRYHRFQGKHLSRLWSDYLEAICHFRQAREHLAADELAEDVANFYYRAGNFADARRLAEEIIQRQIPPPPWWAWNLYGLSQLVLGFPREALAAFQEALPLAPAPLARGTTLNNISQIYDARGDYATAMTYLEQSLKIRREIGDKAGEGHTLNNISQIYQAQGDYPTALTYLEQSLRINREIGDRAGEGIALNNLATLAQAQGDYAAALTYLGQSLKIRREIGDKAGEGTTLNNISQIYQAQGDYAAALACLEQSLKIRREVGDKAGEGTTLNNLATLAHAQGDYDTALTYLEQSLKTMRETGDKAGEGTTLNNIGQIYQAEGDYATALTYLEQSLKISREIGDKAGEGTTLNNISHIYQAQGDYATAQACLEQSLKIHREIGDKAGMIPTLHNMAHLARQRQEVPRALALWAEALSLAQETGNAQGIFHVASTLGSILAQGSNKGEARKFLELAVKVGRQSGFPGVDDLEERLRLLENA